MQSRDSSCVVIDSSEAEVSEQKVGLLVFFYLIVCLISHSQINLPRLYFSLMLIGTAEIDSNIVNECK